MGVIWFSERDAWGQLYLNDLETGKLLMDLEKATSHASPRPDGSRRRRSSSIAESVPPNNTLLVVDALIKANKDFDLVLLPNQRHGYGDAANYMTRRRWDYSCDIS